MGEIAFELRSEYQGTTTDAAGNDVPRFGGGLLALTNESDFDLGAELERGGGVIVVDEMHHRLADLLRAHPALKATSVPTEPAAVASPYDGLTVKQLRERARERELDVSGLDRDALVDVLEASDQATATTGPQSA